MRCLISNEYSNDRKAEREKTKRKERSRREKHAILKSTELNTQNPYIFLSFTLYAQKDMLDSNFERIRTVR